ncbi:MAG: FecR domain-containing protein [bacterium]
MKTEPSGRHPIDVDALLALAAGELDGVEAAEVNGHVAVCRGCRTLYADAREIHREAVRLGDSAVSDVDDVTRMRLWRAVEAEAVAAAARGEQKRAWRIVFASSRTRGIAAAAVLAVVGVAVFGARMAWDPQELPTGPLVAGSDSGPAAVPDSTRAVVGTADGPGTTSRAAGSLLVQKRRVQRRLRVPLRRSAGSPRAPTMRPLPTSVEAPPDGALQSPALTPTSAPERPVTAVRPGEQRLRCGGVLAMGGARVTVVRDELRTATVRLASGRLRLHIPKLPAGGRVEVVTPDARVRVVGTRFTVLRGAGQQTTVSVSEGVVWVLPTGRNRKTVVLRAGEHRSVLGEAAYLKAVHADFSRAIRAGKLQEAARLGRRYLDVTSRPNAAASLKLKLAGILVWLGRADRAAQLYQSVADTAPQSMARQNALAFLARLHSSRRAHGRAVAVWRQLVDRYPAGIFAREALMQLVHRSCGRATPRAVVERRTLRKRYPRHAGAQALLARCAKGRAGR